MSSEIPENTVHVLDHGFVRLDAAMATDLSVVNAARVSFARRKDVMDESDEGLIRFLMRDRHGTPYEHNAFRFHVRAPIFVAREWFRHRIGCLTGDAEVTFVNHLGHVAYRKSMEDLARAWHGGEQDGHAGMSQREIGRRLRVGRRAVRTTLTGRGDTRDARWRIARMRVRTLNEETGEFEFGHIADVIDKGLQPVYELTLADGKALTLTENHRVLTNQGWRTMGNAIGLDGKADDAKMTRECLLLVNGLPAHRTRLRVSDAHKEAIRAARSGPKSTVPVWLDNSRARDLGSLVSVCAPCHRSIHRTRADELAFAERFASLAGIAERPLPARRGFRLTAHAVEVVSVRYVGLRQTYDLSIAGRWHNFVANGIVVHNSFNEFSMRYAEATDDFYVPAVEDVRTQVGKPGAYTFDPVEPELAERTREELAAVYEAAYAAYVRLVEQGVAREVARCVLPVGAYTEFYWTVNARALMNFVSLRAAETAQREIRRYAEAVERFLAEQMPVTHAAFVANARTAP